MQCTSDCGADPFFCARSRHLIRTFFGVFLISAQLCLLELSTVDIMTLPLFALLSLLTVLGKRKSLAQ